MTFIISSAPFEGSRTLWDLIKVMVLFLKEWHSGGFVAIFKGLMDPLRVNISLEINNLIFFFFTNHLYSPYSVLCKEMSCLVSKFWGSELSNIREIEVTFFLSFLALCSLERCQGLTLCALCEENTVPSAQLKENDSFISELKCP